jgi:hypothetical protein
MFPIAIKRILKVYGDKMWENTNKNDGALSIGMK